MFSHIEPRGPLPSSVFCALFALLAPSCFDLALPQAGAQGPQPRLGYLVDGRREQTQVLWQQGHWGAKTMKGEDVMSSLVQWGRLTERLKPTMFLTHGEAVIDLLRLDEQSVKVGRDPYSFSQRPLWAEQSFLRNQVRGFVLQWPAEQNAQDQLRAALVESAETDRVWFDDGEFLDGRVIESLGENSRLEEVRVSRGGREILIPVRRIAAIRFASPKRNLENSDNHDALGHTPAEDGEAFDDKTTSTAKPQWQIGFQDGSFLEVVAVTEADNTVGLALPATVRLSIPAPTFRRSFCFLRPLRDDVVWLGDRKPLDIRHVAFFTGEWPLARNTNLWGGRLREPSQWHDRGLAMHSTTRVAYDLDGSEAIFQARLALDMSAGRRGSVRYFVFSRTDMEAPWEEVYKSPIVRGTDLPKDISVALGKAKQLALIVEFADEGDVLDRACWFAARLVQK
jgi:hypothetical protein